MHLITGHNHFQPEPSVAPLEFDLTPGDAELVATIASAVDAIRGKNVVSDPLRTALESEGFTFVDTSP